MEYNDFLSVFEKVLVKLTNENEEFYSKFDEYLFVFRKAGEKEINEFENYVNLVIPHFYRNFIKDYNPKGLEIMFHQVHGIEEFKEIYDLVHYGEELFKSGYLPIISDGYGNYYCINAKDEGEDILYFADHENEYELEVNGKLSDLLQKLVDQKLERNK